LLRRFEKGRSPESAPARASLEVGSRCYWPVRFKAVPDVVKHEAQLTKIEELAERSSAMGHRANHLTTTAADGPTSRAPLLEHGVGFLVSSGDSAMKIGEELRGESLRHVGLRFRAVRPGAPGAIAESRDTKP
jgi:hypothetical protein